MHYKLMGRHSRHLIARLRPLTGNSKNDPMLWTRWTSIGSFVATIVSIFCCGYATYGDSYDLAADFSNASNPNAAWSFTSGTTLLTHYPQPSDGNTLAPAAANGFWGVGPSFNTDVPAVIKVTLDGSSAPPYTDEDFLVDDVIMHSSLSGDELFLNWTAPNAGSLTYAGSVWYAHSFTPRSNDFAVQLNGAAALNSGTVTNGQGRSNPVSFASAGTLNVSAGDILSISPFSSSGSSGAVVGIDFTVDFTPVPEPTAACLFLAAWLSLLSVKRFGLTSNHSRF